MKNYSVEVLVMAHYAQRSENMLKLINALKNQTYKHMYITVFDDGEIDLDVEGVNYIRTTDMYHITARNSLAAMSAADYVLTIDDDMIPGTRYVENLIKYARNLPGSIIGVEGGRLVPGDTPYTSGMTESTHIMVEVDYLIRSMLLPHKVIGASVDMHCRNREKIGSEFIDDLLFSLANKYMLKNTNFIVPAKGDFGYDNISDMGVGQSKSSQHYLTRDMFCKYIMEEYANIS
jgi:hypothetical protein